MPAQRARPVPSVEVGWQAAEVGAVLLAGSIIAGCALVLATTELGAGDYGQWLMAARPYLGLDGPPYRADAVVPPVVPALLGLVQRIVGDPLVAVQLVSVLVLSALGSAAALAALLFFRSTIAAVMAAAGSLLVTDRFLELFAFGGLLQAAAVAFLFLSAAALYRAGDEDAHRWRWWFAGIAAVGLGVLSHIGTASLLLPAALAVGGVSAMRVPGRWFARLGRLALLAAALVLASVYLLVVLLPGAADLAGNPATLGYRGPDRLIQVLTNQWPGIALVATATVGLVLGAVVEVRRHRIGPWLALVAWTGSSIAVVVAAVVVGAGTDYLRFATPVLAPLVVAAAGAATATLHLLGRRLGALNSGGRATTWSVVLAAILVLTAAPAAVIGFHQEAAGYRLADLGSVRQAGAWIEERVPPESTTLAPVREAKWIEGLTGGATLFSNAFRYSFRPEEWQRSLAADTILRSNGALANEFFFTRFAEGTGASEVPRELSIAVNHAGEFIDLLQTVPAGTRILLHGGETLASLQGLVGSERRSIVSPDEVGLAMQWSGERRGEPVAYRQTVILRRHASTLELRAGISSSADVTGFELELSPPPWRPLIHIDGAGRHAELTFAAAGSEEPRLRVVVARGDASLEASPGGGLRVLVHGTEVRLLVTGMTAASSATMGLQLLEPDELVERYEIGAVLLREDPSFEARRQRLEALGFEVGTNLGGYVVMVRR